MSLSSTLSPKETENQNPKNQETNGSIELVSLRSEAECCKGHSNERVEQQENNTDHDEAATMPDSFHIKGSLKHREGILKILGLSTEDMVARRHPLVGGDEPNQTGPHNDRGQQNSRQHQPRQRVLELRVVH
jgi:hypothetical protein